MCLSCTQLAPRRVGAGRRAGWGEMCARWTHNSAHVEVVPRAAARDTLARMELHEGETVLFEGHPSWRSALLFFAKGIGLGLLVGAVGWFAMSPAAGIAAAAAVVAITLLASFVIRQATKYLITDERLHIRQGIIARSIHETRLSRVQDVSIEQGVFERILRIGKADFDTAADRDDQFVFRGIANPDQVRAAVDTAHRLAEQRGLEAPTGPRTGGV